MVFYTTYNMSQNFKKDLNIRWASIVRF